MQIAAKQGGLNLDIQKTAKVSQKPMYEVERRMCAPLSERRVAIDLLNVWIAWIKARDVRVTAPQLRIASTNISLKLTRAGGVQVAHRCRQHGDRSCTVVAIQDDSAHRCHIAKDCAIG